MDSSAARAICARPVPRVRPTRMPLKQKAFAVFVQPADGIDAVVVVDELHHIVLLVGVCRADDANGLVEHDVFMLSAGLDPFALHRDLHAGENTVAQGGGPSVDQHAALVYPPVRFPAGAFAGIRKVFVYAYALFFFKAHTAPSHEFVLSIIPQNPCPVSTDL